MVVWYCDADMAEDANLTEGDMVLELELELVQPHMAQKPMLRSEVGARALRVRSDVRGHGQVRLCKTLLNT